MAPAISETASGRRPGESCLCCRRRKVKCSRESTGCQNCRRSGLPCVYAPPDPSFKRKRGPYKKKGIPAREAHLEHVVRYLSDPVSQRRNDEDRSESPPFRPFDLKALASREPERASEDLVKDALVALSSTAVADQVLKGDIARPRDTVYYDGRYAGFRHPGAQRLLALWQLYLTRVDPMTKLIHTATFAPTLYSFIGAISTGFTGALAAAVHFAAVSSCSMDECQQQFGESKPAMLKEYRQVLEEEVVRTHTTLDFEAMQALVLYLLCLVREGSDDTWALFSLIVRNAQLLGLHIEPSLALTPYEAEMRRRLWWTICSLENACAEEGLNKSECLFAFNKVKMPSNLQDTDLTPGITVAPQGRRGLTSMSFVLMRWEIMSSNVRMWSISKQKTDLAEPELRTKLKGEYDVLEQRLERKFFKYCHLSRPLDWMIKTVADMMMIKCCLTIHYPRNQLMDDTVPPEQRLEILRLSVMIIRTGQRLLTKPKCPEYFWFFRSYLQWHSLAIIIAEISHNDNPHFVQTAWKVLRPFLDVWDKVYKNKTQDRTWNYVNVLIEKAKATVKQRESLAQPTSGTGGLLPFDAVQSSDQSPESITMSDLNFSDVDFSMPLDVDFEALNAVFNNPDWNEAVNLGTNYD